MKKVTMYSGTPCSYCESAKALLESKNIPFEEIDVWKSKDKAKEALKGIKANKDIFFKHRIKNSVFFYFVFKILKNKK